MIHQSARDAIARAKRQKAIDELAKEKGITKEEAAMRLFIQDMKLDKIHKNWLAGHRTAQGKKIPVKGPRITRPRG